MNYKKLTDLVSEENLSDNKIARVMDMTGTGYRDMLKNKSMKVDTLEKVARHFKVPVSYFFDEDVTELEEPKAEYKKNCCELCKEKDKQIALYEKLISVYENPPKKETHDESGLSGSEDTKRNKAV
jgi:transcriptional regulator with XRE-family HTH domain